MRGRKFFEFCHFEKRIVISIKKTQKEQHPTLGCPKNADHVGDGYVLDARDPLHQYAAQFKF